MATELDKLRQQINYLYKRVKCLEKNQCECSGDSGSSSSEQDNVFKIQTTSSVEVTDAVPAISDILPAINAVTTVVDETNNMFFKVPLDVVVGNETKLYNNIYKLIGLGKGTYGVGGASILPENLCLDFSAGSITLPSNTLLPAKIFEFESANWETPDAAVDAQVGPFVIDTTRPYYFKIFQPIVDDVADRNYKLYLFIGSPGTYGSGETDSVPGDFQLIDTEVLEIGTRDLSVRTRTINVGAVINGSGVVDDNIAKAVNRSFRGQIHIGPLEIPKFGVIKQEIRTRALDGTKETTLIFEKYDWASGVATIASDSEVTDFDIEYSKAITENIITGRTGDPFVHVILNDDLDAPEDGLNNSADTFTTSSSEKTYFVVYKPDSTDNQFKVYEFTGADDTYGQGEPATAVNGDFSPVTIKEPTEQTTVTKTSQLFNDGSDGNSRYVEEADIDTGTGDPPFLRELKVSLTAGEIKTLNSSQIEIIAAPGAGLGIEIISCSTQLNWGSVAFDANDFEIACSTAGAGAAQFRHDPGFLSATADAFARMQLKFDSDAIQVVENDSVVLRTPADSVATGDSTIDVFVIYRIIDLT